jgi:outer membrane protein OmpA-like peptidoglycan-associated protein
MMMLRIGLIIFSFFLLQSCSLVDKLKGGTSAPKILVSDCYGALPLLNEGSRQIQFPGNSGITNEFSNYPVISDLDENNSVWLSFTSEYDGQFFLEATAQQGGLGLIIFQKEIGRELCDDIENGRAEISRFLIEGPFMSIGLKKEQGRNYVYPIRMKQGEEFVMVLFSDITSKHSVNFYFKHIPDVSRENKYEQQKIVDNRDNMKPGNYRLEIRDKETELPVIAEVILEGLSDVDGTFRCSDLYIQPQYRGDLELNISAKGYFYKDSTIEIEPPVNYRQVIYLEKLQSGRSMQIDDIQFEPGTATFIPGTERKLQRLKAFLELNTDLKIEIQGHVMEIGVGTAAGEKMSKARAAAVMRWLVENDISKRRMKAVGYGNSRPIYAEPRFSAEEQANRRVEILVLGL